MKFITSGLYQTGKNVTDVLSEILCEQSASETLQNAVRDGVLNGGKRLRPFLLIESAKLFGIHDPRVLRCSAALECVHCYSLIHDDLPSMDDDDMRRGQPTIHKKYDEATAILAGDGLLTLAFEILSDSKTHKDGEIRSKLCLALAKASGMNGMVGGQMLDLQAESMETELNTAEIEKLQDLKTGKLIQVAVEMGCIIAGANNDKKQALINYAKYLGLAFQVSDDLLDALGDEISVGKKVGKDADKNKATFVSILGLDGAKQFALELTNKAKDSLDIFGDDADTLKQLADFVIDRQN